MGETRNTKGLGTSDVALDRLVPNPLNSNVMPPDYREKLSAHIRRTGRYPHIIVRPHPTEPGKHEILDGHHRVSVLRDLGYQDARCDVWDVDDREAKILLATLNRLEGSDLPIRRAQLLHELLGEWSSEDLAGLLPESEKEIEELHRLLEFPAEQIAAELEAEAAEREKTLPIVVYYVLSHEQAEVLETAIEKASDGTLGRDRKARGLAALATHFLECSANGAR